MSKIGLNNNIYQITGKYLGLINEFIVSVKVHPNDINEEQRKDLIDLFSKMNDSNNSDPQIQLLSVIIERDLRNRKKQHKVFWKGVFEGLNNNPSTDSIEKLEYIVNALDFENSGALAKIKGE